MEQTANQAIGAIFNPALVPLPGYPIPMQWNIEPHTSAKGWVNMPVNIHVVTLNGQVKATIVIHHLINPSLKQAANFKFKRLPSVGCPCA
jgi:hypothetical protein